MLTLTLRSGLRRGRGWRGGGVCPALPALLLCAGTQRAASSTSTPWIDPRNRLVRQAADATPAPKPYLVLPALAALAGAMLLTHSHVDAEQSTNIAGALLIAGGVIATVGTSRRMLADRYKFGSLGSQARPKFSFKIVNEANMFAAEKDLLDKLMPLRGSGMWPPDVETKLMGYRQADERKRKSDISARKEAMHELVSQWSAETAYTSEREALSALAPRAFLLDYVDAAFPPQRPPSRRDPRPRSRAEMLGEEVSLLLACAAARDVVIINLCSPGGSVVEYGLAASHLLRLKQAGIRCIVTVDKVAASGGFMMACCADEIVAAPFAYLGSIGVSAEIPNFHRALNRKEVDYFLFTAGKFKKTVSLFNEVSTEGKEKFQEQVESIHTAFKQHVSEQRGSVMDVDALATGEAWLALQGKELGLVDRLGTSWDVIKEMADNGYDVVKVERDEKKYFSDVFRATTSEFGATLSEGIVDSMQRMLARVSPFRSLISDSPGEADTGCGSTSDQQLRSVSSPHDRAAVRY
jgi:signal peptide peptidase SppA